MSDMFYIVLAYGLTWVVVAGYAMRLRAQRRTLLADELKERGGSR